MTFSFLIFLRRLLSITTGSITLQLLCSDGFAVREVYSEEWKQKVQRKLQILLESILSSGIRQIKFSDDLDWRFNEEYLPKRESATEQLEEGK